MDILSLIGGKAALIGAFAIGCLVWLGTMFKVAFSAGKKSEQVRQAKAESKAVKEARSIDNAVAGNTPDKNREELREWSKQ
jgi:hypothetical protein